MPSSTENVKLGVCSVFFDGADLGYTKGGVEVEMQTSTYEVKVDQFGETPIGELVTGRQVTVKVPLAETTFENMVRTIPGAVLVSNGVAATGTVTFVTAAPVNNDSVTVNGKTFTFKTAPAAGNGAELAIPASITAAATALAAAINAFKLETGVDAVAVAGAVTLTALEKNSSGNSITLSRVAVTPANLTVSGATLSGGVAPTKAKVSIPTGVNINLLSIAKKLVLRPRGTTGAEDFILPKAATPGGLNFSYKIDDERTIMANFKAYPDANGNLIVIGDESAV